MWQGEDVLLTVGVHATSQGWTVDGTSIRPAASDDIVQGLGARSLLGWYIDADTQALVSADRQRELARDISSPLGDPSK